MSLYFSGVAINDFFYILLSEKKPNCTKEEKEICLNQLFCKTTVNHKRKLSTE